MKWNTLTPGGNMRWEKSRVILPEHREGMLARREALAIRKPPTMDEQAITEFTYKLQESLQRKTKACLTYFTETMDITLTGYVTCIKGAQAKLVDLQGEGHWVKVNDILDME